MSSDPWNFLVKPTSVDGQNSDNVSGDCFMVQGIFQDDCAIFICLPNLEVVVWFLIDWFSRNKKAETIRTSIYLQAGENWVSKLFYFAHTRLKETSKNKTFQI
jgi:hypothetical protein